MPTTVFSGKKPQCPHCNSFNTEGVWEKKHTTYLPPADPTDPEAPHIPVLHVVYLCNDCKKEFCITKAPGGEWEYEEHSH